MSNYKPYTQPNPQPYDSSISQLGTVVNMYFTYK